MSTLSGKVAVVTGASQGIGAAIALRLAADGAQVVINFSRNAAHADAVVQTIRDAGGQAHAVQADLTQPAQCASLIDAAVEAYGKLDILVNNAGIYEGDTLDTITAESFDKHFHLNVRGLLLTTQAASRVMQAGAVVVNISSGLARSPYPMVHVYCATKGAVDTLTRSLALELGPRQIRVVGIAPGFTKTEGNAVSAAGMDEFFTGKTPLGRVGQPIDIAAAVALAVSTDAAWITGSTLDVSGGMVF